MLDREMRFRKIGGLLLVVSTCLLLLAVLQTSCVSGPAGGVAQLEPTVRVPAAESSPGATAPTSGGEGRERERHEPTVEPELGSAPELRENGHAQSQSAPPATRLVIPALRVNAPVVEVPLVDGTWDVSGMANEVAHLGGRANPGEQGNVALTATSL